MKAQGEHILLRKPNKAKATEGGIVLPDTMDQKLSYGRVVSIGAAVEGNGVDVACGDVVAYSPQGVEDLEFGSLADIDLVMAHWSNIYLVMDAKDLKARNLPQP
jgi:co-chaperonin GroES (HSP10)|tara:strand:- start:40803 stop:41114 length:312 start_codon:yes stop_codon:yes gene_type:complete